MFDKRYDEIQSGDVGKFTDDTLWVATGPFVPNGYVGQDGRVWGTFPFVANTKLKKHQRGHMQGCADTHTTLFTLS